MSKHPLTDLGGGLNPQRSYQAVRGVKVGIYANPKVGKTHFSLTAPLPNFL